MEPDGIFVRTKTGIIKLYFAELPPEVQRRFNYNPQQAAAFAAAQAPSYSPTQNQQQAPADGGNARVGQIDDTVNAIWALDGRLAQIQSAKQSWSNESMSWKDGTSESLKSRPRGTPKAAGRSSARRKGGQKPAESSTKSAEPITKSATLG